MMTVLILSQFYAGARDFEHGAKGQWKLFRLQAFEKNCDQDAKVGEVFTRTMTLSSNVRYRSQRETV
jgi:hypothetical protein